MVHMICIYNMITLKSFKSLFWANGDLVVDFIFTIQQKTFR